MDDDEAADVPLRSGTTAASARAAGLRSRIVPVGVPDDFHAHVSITVRERVTLGDGGHRTVIEQAYTVEWISPDAWVRLVAQVVAQAAAEVP
jgi:hypothetical protein